MRRLCFILFALCGAILTTAQTAATDDADDQRRPWEEVYEALVGDAADGDDDEAARWEEDYELLRHLAERPLPLNTATREELEQLPFLSAQQVMDLLDYRQRYGRLSSFGELRMVPSMDYVQLALLPYFVRIDDAAAPSDALPSLKDMARHGRQTLTATVRLPFYDRRGDRNGYLGYKYRHWLRYEFDYADRLRLGVIGAQDAGEPFFAGRNRWGYDAYNYYIAINRWGPIDRLVVGKYKLSMGMGLVANIGFSLGKMATLQGMGRTQQTLRPHTSRAVADYFQGAAATLRLGRQLRLTAFGSLRPIDATLNNDDATTAATLITSGYHRTPAEIGKKNNTHLTAAGAALTWRPGAFRLGANAVYTHLDRSLEPNRQTLYRRYYAHGTDFLNASVDYGFTHHLVALSGETALDAHGHVATVNALNVRPVSSLSIVALQRFYSYRYTALYAHAFSDAGHTQNESGFYLGLSWQPLRRLHLQAYADYAAHAWALYQVSQPSHAWDFLGQATCDLPRWTLTARYRAHLRQRDNADKTALTANNDHRARLAATYSPPSARWSAKTQLDMSYNSRGTSSRGLMLAEQLAWQHRWLRLNLAAALFDTDDYQSRVYLYERHLAGDFAMPSYYGEGMRLSLMAHADLGRHLQLTSRIAYTDYFDRSTIGTGLQAVDRSSLTDLDLQLRWRF